MDSGMQKQSDGVQRVVSHRGYLTAKYFLCDYHTHVIHM